MKIELNLWIRCKRISSFSQLESWLQYRPAYISTYVWNMYISMYTPFYPFAPALNACKAQILTHTHACIHILNQWSVWNGRLQVKSATSRSLELTFSLEEICRLSRTCAAADANARWPWPSIKASGEQSEADNGWTRCACSPSRRRAKLVAKCSKSDDAVKLKFCPQTASVSSPYTHNCVCVCADVCVCVCVACKFSPLAAHGDDCTLLKESAHPYTHTHMLYSHVYVCVYSVHRRYRRCTRKQSKESGEQIHTHTHTAVR